MALSAARACKWLISSLLIMGLGAASTASALSGDADEHPTQLGWLLMRSTFRLAGQRQGTAYVGTGFVVRRLSRDRKPSTTVLVTAAHVFKGMDGEEVTLETRKRIGEEWEPTPTRVRIRKGTEPLWKETQDADVAVMYVDLPDLDAPVPMEAGAGDVGRSLAPSKPRVACWTCSRTMLRMRLTKFVRRGIGVLPVSGGEPISQSLAGRPGTLGTAYYAKNAQPASASRATRSRCVRVAISSP